MNRAMDKKTCAVLFVFIMLGWAYNTSMVHLHIDVTRADLLTISAGGGAITPRSPWKEFTVNRAILIVAMALMFH
jgi:hypothetical protein